jgi:hypothetical protein
MDLAVLRVSCCRYANVPILRLLSATIVQCTPTKLTKIAASRICKKLCDKRAAWTPCRRRDEPSNSSTRWNFSRATMNYSPNLTIRWSTIVSRRQTIYAKFVESGTHYKIYYGQLSHQHGNGEINRQSGSIMRFSPRKLFSQFRLLPALVPLTICRNLLRCFVHRVIDLQIVKNNPRIPVNFRRTGGPNMPQNPKN